MKILQITAIDMTMNNFLRPLNIASKKAGWEVHCACSEGPFTDDIKKDNFKFHHVNIDRKIKPISNIKSIIQIIRLIRRIKPDIVHVHTPVASVLGRVAAKIAGAPTIIYTAHGFYFHEGMNKKQYKLFFNIEKYIGRFCTDYILTQSQEDYQIAKDNKFLKTKYNKNYVCISNGIDLDQKYNIELKNPALHQKIRKELNIPENHLIVTFIGRLVKEKGIIDLLNAFHHLSDKNVTFIILGGLPQGERDVETYHKLEVYRSKENFKFMGHVSNADEYLFISDIFSLPSYREGMPRSIIEAMAMKNAILATNIRGSREEVLHGETGYLFQVNDSKKMAQYIDELNNNREMLENMKEAGLQRAQGLYDENDVVKKQLEIFDKEVNK
ncbi:glycosyltransferase family 1 protein [Macrococcus brunensis]|uniref:Glycosyltransferase family 1 protein n=1 Tax=Macrococcus brunensis TaxID=198483 RepID=A0A4R6BAR5_9STAP|nr:glycosyltransferase family 4 protein [Macrococcus brunensis]TDL93391.1 glycosyltransferase family 1 protein [Macrococcus brunensis]